MAESPAPPADPPAEQLERGVHNPRVVDLITPDREAGELVLVMLELRPWGALPEQLQQIEDKFNAYLAYVQSQYLAREYPQYEGLRVRFQLDCAAPPRPEDRPFLDAMRSFAEGEGIRFVLNVTEA